MSISLPIAIIAPISAGLLMAAVYLESLRTRKFQRLHAAISGSNRAITDSSSINEMMQKVCESLVQHGGFVSACVQDGKGNMHACAGPWTAPSPSEEVLTYISQVAPDRINHLNLGNESKRFKKRLSSVVIYSKDEERFILHLLENGRPKWSVHKQQMINEMSNDLAFGIKVFKSAQERIQLDEKAAMFGMSFLASRDGFAIASLDGVCLEFNHSFAEMVGVDSEAPVLNLYHLAASETLELPDDIKDVVVRTGHWSGKYKSRDIRIAWIKKESGKEKIFLTIDDNQVRRLEMQRDTLAPNMDNLTGLYSRHYILDYSQQLDEAKLPYAFIYFDIDHLERLNETFSASLVDRLLRRLADRVRHAVKPTDICGRDGGDEFSILLPGVHSELDARAIADRVIQKVTSPYDFGTAGVSITISVGISIKRPGQQEHDTKSRAVRAMQAAKKEGRNKAVLFDEQLAKYWRDIPRLESDLPKAIENGQLYLHYQPQIHIPSSSLIGYEALLRWKHPNLGDIPPSVFIPMAEETGAINEIGDWVLKQACVSINKFSDVGRIAVNVSAVQLCDPAFVEKVMGILTRFRVDPARIELEITETAVLDNLDIAGAKLKSLRDSGISISIDDFGVGNSSLYILKGIPANRIKIDRSFVEGLPNNTQDLAIVKAIIEMAKALGMDIVAEGIEQQEQADVLLLAGCVEGQGWLYGRPKALEEWNKEAEGNLIASAK